MRKKADGIAAAESAPARRRHPALLALVAILLVEAAALVAAVAYFTVELIVARPASAASAAALIVILAAASIWIGFMARGVLRGQAWTRAAVVVLQVLVAALALGSFQGASARPDLGLLLLLPAVLATVLLFQRPVLEATTARG